MFMLKEKCGLELFPKDKPWPLFTLWTVIMEMVISIWNIIIIVNDLRCADETRSWLIVGLLNSVTTLIWSLLMHRRFVRRAVTREGKYLADPAYKMLLIDWPMIFYTLFTVWVVIWLVVAGHRRKDAVNVDDTCGQQLAVNMGAWIFYWTIGLSLLLLTLVTEGCKSPKWKDRQLADDMFKVAEAKDQAELDVKRGVTPPASINPGSGGNADTKQEDGSASPLKPGGGGALRADMYRTGQQPQRSGVPHFSNPSSGRRSLHTDLSFTAMEDVGGAAKEESYQFSFEEEKTSGKKPSTTTSSGFFSKLGGAERNQRERRNAGGGGRSPRSGGGGGSPSRKQQHDIVKEKPMSSANTFTLRESRSVEIGNPTFEE